MIAIHTKYFGPTNKRGSTVKAYTADGRSVTVSYDDALSSHMAHFKAVEKFVNVYLTYTPNIREMRYGDSADGKGYVFCFGESKVFE